MATSSSSLDSGEYDSSFKFVTLDASGECKALDANLYADKTVNVVVGPTGCGKTSMIRIVAGGDTEPPNSSSSTKNSTGYVVQTEAGEIIFWDTPGLMDTERTETEQRQKLLQDLVSAIKSAKVTIGAFVVLVDGCVTRLPGEYYEWMTALMTIVPANCEKRILVTKLNSPKQLRRYKGEVEKNNQENCAVLLKKTGHFSEIVYIGEDVPTKDELAIMFKTSNACGADAETLTAPLHPDDVDGLVARLQEKLALQGKAEKIEQDIRILRGVLAKEQTTVDIYDTMWYRCMWKGWLQGLKDQARRTRDTISNLEKAKDDPAACAEIVRQYKEQARSMAMQLQKAIQFMDTLTKGAKLVEGVVATTAAVKRKRWEEAYEAVSKVVKLV